VAKTLTDTSVAEIEAWLEEHRNHEQPSQRTSVATHMAWIPDEWSRAAAGVMRGLGDRVPSRTLLLHPEPDATGDGFDATITVDRFAGERSGVSVEIVQIRLRGSAAEAPASVVVPLQLPDLPVFLRWRGRPAFGRKYYEDLVGVAGGGQAQQMRDEPRRNAAESGLGIGEALAHHQAHQHASEIVSDAALPRHAAIELPRAEDQGIARCFQRFGHAKNVVRVMLTVGIGRDHTGTVRPVHQRVVHPRLQRRPFSEVDRVTNDMCVFDGDLSVAAIVHNDDRPRTAR